MAVCACWRWEEIMIKFKQLCMDTRSEKQNIISGHIFLLVFPPLMFFFCSRVVFKNAAVEERIFLRRRGLKDPSCHFMTDTVFFFFCEVILYKCEPTKWCGLSTGICLHWPPEQRWQIFTVPGTSNINYFKYSTFFIKKEPQLKYVEPSTFQLTGNIVNFADVYKNITTQLSTKGQSGCERQQW